MGPQFSTAITAINTTEKETSKRLTFKTHALSYMP